MEKLFVGGVVPLTTVDYPEHLATVVFLQGCPWRCVYCHNPLLQKFDESSALRWDDVLKVIKERSGFIEAVVFSGGEPLAQSALSQAIDEVRQLDLKVGVHTSGSFPRALSKIISKIDWIGFDVKTAFADYESITRVAGSGAKAKETLDVILASGVDFEVRMTMDKSIPLNVAVETLKNLAELGVKKVAIQKCRDKNEKEVEHPLFSDKIALDDLAKRFEKFIVR